MSRLPTTVGPIPPCPRAWRIVAAAVAVLCADRLDARCGADEVATLLWLSGTELPSGYTLHALCAAEARGAVRYRDGAWEPA